MATVVGAHVSMRDMALDLVPLAEQARAAGVLGGAGREVLPLTKRNARKWADAPKQYGLEHVDAA